MFLKTLLKYKSPISVTILLITNLFFLTLYTQQKNQNTDVFVKNYPLIDPARTITDQEHFFSTIEPLRADLKAIVEKYEKEGDRIGLYFEFLNTGSNISINQDDRFWPASLSKMPTALVTMKKVQEKEWNLSNELVLFEDDKDPRFGNLHNEVIGTRFTIETLLKEMLVNSDNTSHKILVRNSRASEYDDVINALGMEKLFDNNYDITAKEYSRIFRSLYNASYLNKENSQKILSLLSETNFNELIASGLPENTKFSHKIGEEYEEKVFLDSGIVYIPNRPYLLTVMIKVNDNESIEKASEIMKLISEKSYEYVAKY